MAASTENKKCTSCAGELEFLGQVPLRSKGSEGIAQFFFGEFTELTEKLVPLDLFRCNACGRVEMYDLDFSLQKTV